MRESPRGRGREGGEEVGTVSGRERMKAKGRRRRREGREGREGRLKEGKEGKEERKEGEEEGD